MEYGPISFLQSKEASSALTARRWARAKKIQPAQRNRVTKDRFRLRQYSMLLIRAPRIDERSPRPIPTPLRPNPLPKDPRKGRPSSMLGLSRKLTSTRPNILRWIPHFKRISGRNTVPCTSAWRLRGFTIAITLRTSSNAVDTRSLQPWHTSSFAWAGGQFPAFGSAASGTSLSSLPMMLDIWASPTTSMSILFFLL